MCAPLHCRYSVVQRVDFLYILTNLFSVYGGLIIVYQLIIPLIVKKIRIWWVQRGTRPTTVVEEEEEVITIRTRLFRLWLFLRSTLIELNVFSGIIPSVDPYEIQNERLATRMYILTFILISLPLLFINTFMIRLHIETVENPSETTFEQLLSLYNNSLQCPCSTVIVSYREFSNNIYKIHPVCNRSDFVNGEWVGDFSLVMQPQIAILKSICQRSLSAVDLAIVGFISLELITGHLLSRELLYERVRAVHRQLQARTKVEILTPFQLNRILAHTDKLMRRSDVRIYNQFQQIETIFASYNNGTCHCALTPTCIREIVPSFYVGCYAADAILQSTLECFYHADCVALIESHRLFLFPGRIYNATALNPNATRFLPNTTTEPLFNNLMLEEWYIQINYTKYYKFCNPISCTYSYPKRTDLLSVITLLLGLLSGLNVILKILVPFVVKTIRNCIIHRQIISNFKTKFASWNTFPTYASRRGDLYQLHTEKIATRIYALIFILCFVIISIYKIAAAPIRNDIVYNPTQVTFDQLQKSYGTTMKCPFKDITISYGSFVSISPIFHQVCSSHFVSSSWLSFLFESSNSTNNRLFILSQFQFLSHICEISKSFAFNAIFTFTNDSFISTQTITESTLHSDISSLMAKSFIIISKSVSEMNEFIQGLTHSSAIISGLYSNWKLSLSTLDHTTVYTNPISYGNCSCGVYVFCTQETMIPGLLIGCYPSSAMMSSTLECFYNETCISMFFGSNNWSSLNVNHPSRFSPYHTVKSIVDQLMIEEWKNITNYTGYYDKCAPTSCTYSYSERFSFIYTITMFTSLYGGLTMVLRFIVYYFVKYGRSLYHRHRFTARVDVNHNTHE